MNAKLQNSIKEIKEIQIMKKELNEQMKNIYIKIEDLNKKSNLQVINKNKVDVDKINSNEKNNSNSFENTYYNINNNNNELNKNINNVNKWNNLPNLSSPLSLNNFKNKKNKNLKNEFNFISRDEEEQKKELSYNQEKYIYENNFRKSSKNTRIKDIENLENKIINQITQSSREDNIFPIKNINDNKLNENKFKSSSNYMKINLKHNNKKIIFDAEVKDDIMPINQLDEQTQINFDSNNNNKKKIEENYENEYFGKTTNELFNSIKKINYKEIIRPYLTSNIKKENLNALMPKNKSNNNLTLIKKELIDNLKNESNNFFSSKNIKEINRKVNPIDCNLVNLNLLDLTNNNKRNEINFSNENIKKSLELRNKRKKKTFKSTDSNSQIKKYPTLIKTSYSFYNLADTGQIRRGNLFKNLSEYNIKKL